MENTKTGFKVGDMVFFFKDKQIIREIVKVRKASYDWKYPEYGETLPGGRENYFDSRNSSDPNMEYWKLIEQL